MRDEMSNEVRVKLHMVCKDDSTSVKNLWMCLNYDHKPTIGHIVEHIRHNYASAFASLSSVIKSDASATTAEPSGVDVTLYLEDYWLPPCEHSRLLREGDCIKVELTKQAPLAQPATRSSLFATTSTTTYNPFATSAASFYKPLSEPFKTSLQQQQQQQVAQEQELTSFFDSKRKVKFNTAASSVLLDSESLAAAADSAYSCFDDFQADNFNNSSQQQKQRCQLILPPPKLQSQLASSSADNKSSSLPKKEQSDKKAATQKPIAKPQQQQQQAKTSSNQKSSTNKGKMAASCYKKFAIGSYVHLLNEEVQKPAAAATSKSKKDTKKNTAEEQLDDDAASSTSNSSGSSSGSEQNLYEKLAANKRKTDDASTKFAEEEEHAVEDEYARGAATCSTNWDQIASRVNSTGKAKWKNSTKPTASNGPKHIIFPSSSSSSSASSSSSTSDSSDSSSSSASDDAGKKKKKTTATAAKASSKPKSAVVAAEKVVNIKQKVTTTTTTTTTSKPNAYVEPSREQQLNALSYARTFQIENTKSLNEFKKIFDQSKLNAPSAEEMAASSVQVNLVHMLPESANEVNIEASSSNNNSNSSSSSSGNDSSMTSSTSSSETTQPPQNASKTTEEASTTDKANSRIDYEKLEALTGVPRVHDKLAFQMLEISSNFTPEISKFKNGTVIDFDSATNEVTLKLNSKYNAVLKRPNKFSVVFDEDLTKLVDMNATDEAAKDDQDASSHQNNNEQEDDDENILRMDWRNLINVKLLPKEQGAEANTLLPACVMRLFN